MLVVSGCGGGAPEVEVATLRITATQHEIVLADTGGEATEVLVGGSEGTGVSPGGLTSGAWSPDGRLLAFETRGNIDAPGDRGFRTQIYVVEHDGSRVEPVLDGRGFAAPVFTPDGESIVYSRRSWDGGAVPAGSSLWAMDADGENPRRLVAEDPHVLLAPSSVSPDGETVLYTRTPLRADPSTEAVYSVGIEGGEPTRFFDRASDATFSPDGERIAVTSFRDGNGTYVLGDRELPANELYVADADGSAPERLTETRFASESSPTWLPGGEAIAYTSFDGERGESEIVVANSDGSCPEPLVSDGSLEEVWRSPVADPSAADAGRLDC